MIELYITKNNNDKSASFGKFYPRVRYKQTMNIHDMAVHMAEHNTPFSEGTIEGILRDFVKCTREQTLMGNTVKVDNLAIFKVSCIGNGSIKLYDADNDKVITASIGEMKKTDKTGPAVQSLKLLAQATGDYTREELNKDGRLAWTDQAQAMIAEAKGSLTPTPSPTGEGSQSGSNSGSQNSGNSGNSGSQNQQNSVAAPTISGVNPFEETSQVSISGPDGATIYYSENGDDPDSNDTLYTQPFTIDETTTIKAIAIKDGVSSQVTTKVFTKGTGGSGGFETGS
ncbi:MAG: hypothetical protein E7107_05525 [Prevotella sp.]|nr:hypothetical protein [Prevotella sp.]